MKCTACQSSTVFDISVMLVHIMITITVGKSDQLKPFDVGVWMLAWQTESELPHPFLPAEFEEWAADVLQEDFNLERHHITAPEVKNLYLYLSQQEPPSFLAY